MTSYLYSEIALFFYENIKVFLLQCKSLLHINDIQFDKVLQILNATKSSDLEIFKNGSKFKRNFQQLGNFWWCWNKQHL